MFEKLTASSACMTKYKASDLYNYYKYTLHYNDQQLRDFRRIADYDIQNKSYLQLSFLSEPVLVSTIKQSFATLDYKSTVVEVPETGVQLDVPEGAIPEDKTVDVRLSIHWGRGDGPPLENDQFVIGPSVCCEPDGTTFCKPVTLTRPHSARNITSRNLTVWTKTSQSKYGSSSVSHKPLALDSA